MTDRPPNVTVLLRAAASGDRRDVDALLAAIYDDLKRLAASQLGAGADRRTLNPTALVHEAYFRLIDQRSTDWKDRLHFFAVAARVIRRVLVDQARAKHALKRGGAAQRESIDQIDVAADEPPVDMLALEEALEELAAIDARQATIVELRFFGGLSVDEIAEHLEISPRSVDREWACARAWLHVRLEPDAEADADA
ncbi:MAG: sigma-70 family RNA polymerase sigma factor [Phycisphaerae bacterium]|nr:sigma-70 family RNA polymerase sigma factor [Phycisphaerae bacterium]